MMSKITMYSQDEKILLRVASRQLNGEPVINFHQENIPGGNFPHLFH